MKKIQILAISAFLLNIFSPANAQIPIRQFVPSIAKMDTQFHRLIRDSGFSIYLNRWLQEADMDGDGKKDLVLQPYLHSDRRDGIISVFYNRGTSGQPLFKNYTNASFFTLGDPGQFTVGDVNGDGKPDILAPTQNYHGQPQHLSPYLYPNGGDHTPDKLWLQRDTGFQRFVFPDNFNTESGNLYSLGSNNKDILISNYFTPNNIPPYTDRNLLYKYKFNSDTTGLIRSTTFYGGDRNYFIRTGAIRAIDPSDTIYNYFDLEKYRPGCCGLDSVIIMAFRKTDSLTVVSPTDTVALMKFATYYTYGYEYYYRPVNDWGIFVVDLNNDGQKEVVTHEFSYYNGPASIDTAPPHTRIQVYNKTGNITSSWIDADVEYDPQRVSHGDGISVVDINGDGLPDILPYMGWGWWSWSSPDYISLEPQRRQKRILLNTGNRFKAFTLDLRDSSDQFIYQDIGYGFYYPFGLDDNSAERSILVMKTANQQSSDSLSAIPAIKLDFSQFKFPCSTHPPAFNLTTDTLLCNFSDSALLRIDSVKGYQSRWYKNGLLVGSKHFLYARDTGYYNLIITNLGGCEASQNIRVKLAALPSVSFSVNASVQCLTGNNYLFTNTSTITSGSLTHTWNFGDGGTAQSLNSNRAYATPGTYSVKLISTSNNGCKDSITHQVTVNPMPVANYSVNSANPQCLTGNNYSFTNTSTISTGTLTYIWNFGDGGSAITINATKTYATAGNYSVKLISTSNNGCKDSTTHQVTVNPMPVANYSVNSANPQCLTGNNYSFTNASTISSGTLTHVWNFGDGGSALTINATKTYTTSGTYSVKLISTSNYGCKDSTTKSIRVDPSPTASLVSSPYNSIQPGLLTAIIATISPAGNYMYSWYRNNTVLNNETGITIDSIGYKLWSGAYKMTIENLPPLLPCRYTTAELVIGDSISSKLFIFPNPTSGQFKVSYYSSVNTQYQILITDMKGAEIYRKSHAVTNGFQVIDINISSSSSGIYVLQVLDPSGKSLAIGKLLIQ